MNAGERMLNLRPKKIGFTALAVWSLFLCSVGAERPPNIILIMADDVSWACFGSYGSDDFKTPHIDALAEKGLRFEQCYSAPICTPSRVMIMSGQYNFRNYTHFGYMNPADKTFGNLMQDAGYKTAIAGKWQLNGVYDELPGCDDANRPFKAGFDEFCLWQVTTTGKHDKDGKVGGERYWSPPVEHNGRFISMEENEGKYGPDIMSNFICDFIERNAEGDQPFFAYYPMLLPHGPCVPTPDTIGDRPRTQVANKKSKNGKVHFSEMMTYLDKIVGRIVTKTEALGIAENTIILFTSDNGSNPAVTSSWKGQMVKGDKGGMTDMGTHVPLVAYWKGHTPQGKVLQDMVDFTDFYPTLAAAAGKQLNADDPIDGFSFLPQLMGNPGTQRDWVFCHYQPYLNRVPGQFARSTEYKLYRDGRFYRPDEDLKEEHDLSQQVQGERMMDAHKKLKTVLEAAPPVPMPPGNPKKAKERPLQPDWRKL